MPAATYHQHVELRQLEAFVAVADELHFGRAAQKLHVGQPTLSDLVKRLEREMGTPLFTRTTRRVVVTEAGVELLGRAKAILDEIRAPAQLSGGSPEAKPERFGWPSRRPSRPSSHPIWPRRSRAKRPRST